MLAALVFSTIRTVPSPPPQRVKENSAVSGCPGSILRFHPAPSHPSQAEGAQSAFRRRPALMYGLTADFSNVKRWATYDLCGGPPVLSHPPPTASRDVLSQPEDCPSSSAVAKWTPLFDRLPFVVGRGYDLPSNNSWSWFPVFASCEPGKGGKSETNVSCAVSVL